jgi:uncharacterized repeat protein (TIGR01451 family)
MAITPAARVLTPVVLALALASAPASAQGLGADLSVGIVDFPDPVAPGADLTYTITVRNDGPQTASLVVLTDALGPNVEFQSAVTNGGSCSGAVGVTVTCALGTLFVGTVVTVTIVVKPLAPGPVINSASVLGAVPDPNLPNNSATQTTTVTGGSGPGADLTISKADAPDPIQPGSDLNYTVTVANNGPEVAQDVTVTDILPAVGQFGSAAASQGSCGSPTAAILTCSLGSLDSGSAATVQIVFRPTTEGALVNNAAVLGTTLDLNPLNNAAVAITTVSQGAPLPEKVKGLAACTILGTALNDVLVGTEGDDVLCGLDGNDSVKALGGRDSLLGGDGKDRLKAGGSEDVLKGQRGSDVLQAGPGKDRLNGGKGRDRLNGGAGKDRCGRGKGDALRSCP